MKIKLIALDLDGTLMAEGHRIPEENLSAIRLAQAQGMRFTSLHELLRDSQVVCTCLNKNVLLLGAPEFAQLGSGKILFNTSIGPGFDPAALEQWVRGNSSNYFFCDTRAAAGSVSDGFFALPNVTCRDVSAGRTAQAAELLSKKVLDNLRSAARPVSYTHLPDRRKRALYRADDRCLY